MMTHFWPPTIICYSSTASNNITGYKISNPFNQSILHSTQYTNLYSNWIM